MSLTIYPPPKKVTLARRRLQLQQRHFLKLTTSFSDYLTDALLRFTHLVEQKITITFGDVIKDETLITIQLGRTPGGLEAYQISTSEQGFLLKASTETGVFRGLSTLEQLLSQIDHDSPYINIEDEPDFTFRGVMLDVSRCKVPTLDTLEELIDSFAKLKYNQLQLYTEHTFAFTRHPLVWADASPYTATDMLQIQAYCNARYIELVPNLNCFGHFERWLKYPEYHRFAECPKGFVHPLNQQPMAFGSTLKPNRQSLTLINELHGEYLPIFDSDYLNVGGDEPWELGQGWSKSRCDNVGATNVYVDFLSRIRQLVEKRGRTMMFWSDIVLKHPESLKSLSRDLVALNWGYDGNHPFKKQCQQVAEQQIPFYVCPGTSSWNSLLGRTGNMVKNLANAARNGDQFGATGYLVTDWGDHGHHQYLPISYPGFALGACQSWNRKGSNGIDLDDLVNRIYFNEPEALTAKLLQRMGRVLELVDSPIRNATIFNYLLFSGLRHASPNTERLAAVNLERCTSELNDIKSNLHLIRVKDGQLIAAEFENAIDMAIHGIERFQYLRESQRGDIKNPGGKVRLAKLRTNLSIIIGRHEKLWLLRNRPGGLNESTAHLQRSLSRLQ